MPVAGAQDLYHGQDLGAIDENIPFQHTPPPLIVLHLLPSRAETAESINRTSSRRQDHPKLSIFNLVLIWEKRFGKQILLPAPDKQKSAVRVQPPTMNVVDRT